LRELSTVTKFQQQLGKEFGKLETEQVAKGEISIEEEWKQLKAAITEAYQPRPDKRRWFDDECRVNTR
jgi:hypothetical protein